MVTDQLFWEIQLFISEEVDSKFQNLKLIFNVRKVIGTKSGPGTEPIFSKSIFDNRCSILPITQKASLLLRIFAPKRLNKIF